MGGRGLSKLRRELARPARRLGRFAYKVSSGLYSPYLYDMTAGRRTRAIDAALPWSDHIGIFVIAPFDGLWPSHFAVLDHMRAAGVTPLIVSNAPLSGKDIAQLADHCVTLIERPNHGYDFGAYRAGCLFLGDRVHDLSRLTLINDSTWFPLTPQNWFDGLLQPGVTAATSNYGASRVVPDPLASETWSYGSSAPEFHLQSYAVSFGQDVLRDPGFRGFWQSYPLVNDKELTVARGEIGLSQWARAQGWSLTSTYPIEALDQHLAHVPADRLRQIAQNTIVLGNPKFHALKAQVLAGDDAALRPFILAAARCLGVCYALPDLNLREMAFPFLKKSPVWLQKEASDITLRLIDTLPEDLGIKDEAISLRRKLLDG